MVPVKPDRRLIEHPETINGRARDRAGTSQVRGCLRNQAVQWDRLIQRIPGKVEEYPAIPHHPFPADQKVDQGGTLCLPDIKWPLIPFQEYPGKHVGGIAEKVRQKFPRIPSVLIRRHKPGQDLHVGAGHVPPGMKGGHPELPFRQVFPVNAGLKRHAAASQLTGRVHTVPENTGRSARCQNQRFTQDDPGIRVFRILPVQTENAVNLSVSHQEADHLQGRKNRDPEFLCPVLKTLRHEPRGVRSGTGSASAPVMVRLIPHILPVSRAGKRNTRFQQEEKASCRQSRLTQGDIPVYGAAGKQILRHFQDTVLIP